MAIKEVRLRAATRAVFMQITKIAMKMTAMMPTAVWTQMTGNQPCSEKTAMNEPWSTMKSFGPLMNKNGTKNSTPFRQENTPSIVIRNKKNEKEKEVRHSHRQTKQLINRGDNRP